MRALTFDNGVATVCDDVEPPAPAAAESRVDVLLAGVCSTDLALRRGYMGFSGIPGHEFVGIAVDGPLAGQRVVGVINAGCGDCDACRRGLARHCSRRSVLGILGRPGCFADRLRLPHENLRAVPDSISNEAAVFAEPLAAAFEIDEQLEIAQYDSALVVGDGRLGLLCAQVLASRGIQVTIAGRHPERVDLLASPLTHRSGWFESTTTAPQERFPLVVEATGDPTMLARVLPFTQPRGVIVLKTTSERPATLDLAPIVIDEIQIVGSRCGRFAPALEALASGEIEVEGMIDARLPLERGVEALERAAAPGVLKVLIEMRAGPSVGRRAE